MDRKSFLRKVSDVLFISAVVFFVLAIMSSGVSCSIEIDTSQVDIERVRFVTPDTYFPSEVQVKHRNVGDSPIRSIRHTVEYHSPVVDTTYWTREIICRYGGDGLQPGELSHNTRCDWKDGNVPPVRERVDREPNASLFFTDVSISPVADSTGM